MTDGAFASKDPRGKMEQKDPNQMLNELSHFTRGAVEGRWSGPVPLPASLPNHAGAGLAAELGFRCITRFLNR
jgi:hypothetical protein